MDWLKLAEDLGPAKDLKIPQVGLDTVITNVVNILFSVVGGLSVIFIIVGGLMYVVSSGNPERTKRARETILYALVGLVISISAFALVRFLTGRI